MTASRSGRPRVALVTGASSGIGLATAVELAGQGTHLVLLARAEGPLADAAARCRATGAASVTTHAVDVRDASAVQRAVDQVHRQHASLDVVVQSAGVAAYGRFEEVPVEVFDGVLATNVLGSANVVRAVLPRMRDQDHGTIVLLGSVIGTIAAPLMSPYVVGKWAIRALARQLQLENRDRKGVHITLVTPGSVDTPIYLKSANYMGRVGRPPPPSYAPQTVARAIVAALDRPPRVLGVGGTNPVMTLGFVLLPRLYDLLVGPLFAFAGRERRTSEPTAGNVLAAQPHLDALRGRHPGLTRWTRRGGMRS